jgi:hypothetical protein
MLSERLFKDGVLTIDEAHRVLSPNYKDIMRCINEGLYKTQELRQREPEYCAPLTSRTWANMVHDQIALAAQRIFARKGKEIVIYTEKGFLVVDFNGRIFLRFKKLHHNLLPCNIETEQQRSFDEQTLFGGPVTHVTAGYRLNEFGMYKDAHIVCIEYHKVLWSLRLPESEEQGKEIVSTPIVPIQETYVVGRNKIANKANKSSKRA